MYDFGIEIEIRGQIREGYRLKVAVNSIGMYIDGFRALKSTKNVSGYWIQPPAQQLNGKWIYTTEFNTKTEFWTQLEKKCIEAISDYNDTKVNNSRDIVLTDISDEPINLDDIPDFDR